MEQDSKTIEKGKQIGKIIHYFSKIGVAVLELEAGLKIGDTIIIASHHGDFEQAVDSMQVEHEQVTSAKSGDAVGLKVSEPVKEGELVYLQG